MNVVSRGIRNAFRNSVRTLSVVTILGTMLGLAFVMLIANRAVDNKIQTTMRNIGTTILVSPSGFTSGASVSTALKQSQTKEIASIPHVAKASTTLTSQLQTEGTTNSVDSNPGEASGAKSRSEVFRTNLKSPFTFDCEEGICSGGSASFRAKGGAAGPALPKDFSMPISVIGTDTPSDPRVINVNKYSIVKGTSPSPGKNEALVSRKMAEKNNLTVGSSFRAYDQDIRVSGIFESDTNIGNGTIVMPLDTLQRLSLQNGVVTQVIVTADSLENLQSTTSALKKYLGSSADITSKVDEAQTALAPLQSVKQISFYSLVGSAAAAAITLALVMVMIVRERKREIGVLKAIGFSSTRVTTQFIIESLTITSIAFVLGLVVGAIASQPVAKALLDGASSNNVANGIPVFNGASFQDLQNIQVAVGTETILIGFAASILTALVSSAVVTLFITKIKPAEVLRGE